MISYEHQLEVYTYSMMIWPWMVLTSVVSRLFIERQAARNPFSPVKDLPILGFFGAFAWATWPFFIERSSFLFIFIHF